MELQVIVRNVASNQLSNLDEGGLRKQFGNYGNLLSPFVSKNYVKSTPLVLIYTVTYLFPQNAIRLRVNFSFFHTVENKKEQ